VERGTHRRPSKARGSSLSDIQIAPGLKRKFRERLLKWYAYHGRDLPWRHTSDPYHILVSEIMLQQTQVDRVLPKYEEWLRKYPTMHRLAEAPLAEVKKDWYPLGYNIRPVRLHSIACESVARYGGALPRDSETLLSFKGIGRYTAGALRSFAFREDAPILDTNVRRVLQRVFVGDNTPMKRTPGRRRNTQSLWDLSQALIPKGRCYDFNQALMDFGAMLCTARDPYCLLCPMKDFCRTYPFAPARPRRAKTRPFPLSERSP
jgi:A/G-specific adenine glycosylase